MADTPDTPRNSPEYADPSPPLARSAEGMTPVKWLICAIAAIGFAFDIYVLLVAPLILPPAMREFSPHPVGPPPSAEFLKWVGLWKGLMFFVPALVGGGVGLVGGYLTDRLGRRRVLTYSILLYAVSAFLSAFATNVWMLLILRCTTFIGVCVEFVAAVAWLAELFPEPKIRERVLGFTQAFSSIGGLMAAGSNYLALRWQDKLPALHIPGFLTSLVGDIAAAHQHEAWRYTVLAGVLPAIPLIVIRPFLPESPAWARKKAAGTLRRPNIGELFSPQLLRTTVVTTILFACCYGAAFGAIQQMPDIAPGLADVKADVAAALAKVEADHPRPADPAAAKVRDAKVAGMKREATTRTNQLAATNYAGKQEIGGLVGRVLLAILAAYIISRRRLLWTFLIPGLFVVPFVFAYMAGHNRLLFTVGHTPVTLFAVGMFLAGLLTVAQFSFWGNYLPLAYPLHLRGTGESVAANLGGRMIGTSFAFITSMLAASTIIPGATAPAKWANAAALVAAFVYGVGFVVSFFLPEPPREELPDDEAVPPGARAEASAAAVARQG